MQIKNEGFYQGTGLICSAGWFSFQRGALV
jgi:hypothetical protein